MRSIAVALALTCTHGFLGPKLPTAPMRGAPTQLQMRLGAGSGGTRGGRFTGRLGAGWKKGIKGPGGGGGINGGGNGPPRDVSRFAAVWKSISELGYPENYCGDLREPPRHRADAVTGTESRRWHGTSTPSSRGSYEDNIASSMAWGA